MSLYLGNNLISGIATPVEPTRNIGQIIQSTLPLTDAGLHLLDGTLISGSGSYSDFVDYIADLYIANPTANYFIDETTWQNTVTQYGVCGKFVYDSTNNTVRLPKVTGIIEGTTDISALGDLVKESLPNIIGTAYSVEGAASKAYPWYNAAGGSGVFSGTQATSNVVNGGNLNTQYTTAANSLDFNAHNSNTTYQDNAPVQPQTIKCFVYIVIATSTKTDIQVDIDEIATDLNGKADVDLSNTTDQAKILMGGMAMPSDTYINLTLGASDSTYTAPANGWFCINMSTNAVAQYINMQNVSTGFSVESGNPASGNWIRVTLPVLKNDVVLIGYSANEVKLFRFYYAQGSESEAN